MDANIWILILPNCTGVTQRAVSRELILTKSMFTYVLKRPFCHSASPLSGFSDQQCWISNQVHGICLAIRALRETSLGHYPTSSTFQSSCNIDTKNWNSPLHTSPILLKCANSSTSVTGPKKPDFWGCQLSETKQITWFIKALQFHIKHAVNQHCSGRPQLQVRQYRTHLRTPIAPTYF